MHTLPSVMSHDFSRSPQANIPRSKFDRSHGLKTTFDSGNLVPVFLDEALPGDVFKLDMSVFARLATPIVPFMDNLFLDSFFFSVPMRLVWDNWQKFNGEQAKPGDSTDFLIPQIVAPAGGYPTASLYDYFGIPTQVASLSHSALWNRAYNLIWNEYFRDENLQDSLEVPTDDGPDDSTLYTLQRRGKRYDYFTSCLPWPQKGPAVELPLGTSAPVISSGSSPWLTSSNAAQTFTDGRLTWEGTGGPSYDGLSVKDPTGNTPTGATLNFDSSVGKGTGLVTDLTSATAATINSLRQAFQIQKLYERDARGGTRYTEIVKSHFGVNSRDSRLQRPEFLGGHCSPIIVNPVAQTSPTGTYADTPQGNLAAFATVSDRGHGFRTHFTEHCLVVGLIAVRADLNYQQGLNRMFSRRTRWDFYWPALSHIGEQAVLNKEIYAQGTSDDSEVFGYQERFAEYRYKPSLVTGQFRSNDANTLSSWHLAQNFASLPALNSSFIEENPPVQRVIATTDYPEFLFDSYFKYHCARPMPTYSVPGLVDHF